MLAVLEGIELDDNTARSSCSIRQDGMLGDATNVVLQGPQSFRLSWDFLMLGRPSEE